MHTRRFRSTLDGPAPRHGGFPWLAGTLAVLLVAGSGVLVSATQHSRPTAAALTDQNPGITAVATTQLNLREAATGDTTVDLDDIAVVGRVAPGSQVEVTCRFTGTEAPGAGDTWYRLDGAAVPPAGDGEDIVASAHYLRVTSAAVVPACAETAPPSPYSALGPAGA